MFTAKTAFDRYQEIRSRLPAVETNCATVDIDSLLDIADQTDAFVFDAFGVLNVGETLIEGADHRIDQLRARGCAIRILTNAASYDRNGAIAKFKRLGIRLHPDEIITSRDAALTALDERTWGVIAAPSDTLTDIAYSNIRLGDDPADFNRAEGFLFLSSDGWTTAKQRMLESSLSLHPRPVLIANADIVAPRDGGLSLEPGYFGHLIADQIDTPLQFFGKPFPEVYSMAEATLPNVKPDRVVMCGDTLHTDIIGAAAKGWRTALITQDGLFAGHDVGTFCELSGIHPDWRMPRI